MTVKDVNYASLMQIPLTSIPHQSSETKPHFNRKDSLQRTNHIQELRILQLQLEIFRDQLRNYVIQNLKQLKQFRGILWLRQDKHSYRYSIHPCSSSLFPFLINSSCFLLEANYFLIVYMNVKSEWMEPPSSPAPRLWKLLLSHLALHEVKLNYGCRIWSESQLLFLWLKCEF